VRVPALSGTLLLKGVIMKNEYIYSALLSDGGYEKQTDQCIEEMAEAIVAINHWKRGRSSFEYVITELTHVDQMIKQMKFLADIIHCRGVWKREQQKTHRRLLKLLHSKTDH
jgi:hypothetical protein